MANRSQNRSAQGVRTWMVLAIILVLLALIGFVGWKLFHLIGADFGAHNGGSSVAVPSVVGKDEQKANELISGAGLIPTTVRSDFNDTTPKGQVYLQYPEAGLQIRPGRTVSIYISLGPASFVVPDLLGEHINNAPAKLAKAGFSLGNVQKIFTKLYPAGRIVNQNPKKGQEMSSGVPVDVVIADSTNVPTVAMPMLTGQPLGSAEDLLTLKENNLQLAEVNYVADDVSAQGTITRQDPPAGKEIPMGSKVEVDVAVPTSYAEQKQRTVNLHIRVPNGPDDQRVLIKFTDELGEQTKLDEKHLPGDVIECSIDLDGKAKIQIFVGDMKNPLREEKL